MQGEDKRLTTRLRNYWDRLRKDMPLPGWEKFNAATLEDIWGSCCVWRVEVATLGNRKNQFIYEYVGSNAKEAFGKDMTGAAFNSHLQDFQGARITARIHEVVDKATPLGEEGTFINAANKTVKYRSCLLPFGTPEGKVTHIVLGLSWRAF